jgi:hypothetical protein
MIQARFNKTFDSFVRPTIRTRMGSASAFQVCGCIGLELAVWLALGLILYRGLSPLVMGLVIGSAIMTFYTVAYATKIVTNEERLTYYHHEIGVTLVAVLTLWLFQQPILAYLDVTLLGVGLFLACGRIGCLMVGCCHGRPSRWGVCYTAEHVDAGFPFYYVGVRLFPIQAVESLCALCIVVVGSAMVLQGALPGAALAWYTLAYNLARFCLEFMRGDSARSYWRGFSEGQWTALLLTWIAIAAELLHLLPAQSWHLFAALGMTFVFLVIGAWRRSWQAAPRPLLHQSHIKEVAVTIRSNLGPDDSKSVPRRSRGIDIASD